MSLNRIPRGVAADDRLAVVHDRDGVLVAFGPTTGEIRWRRGNGLRPCAIAHGSVVSARLENPPGLTIVVLAETDGRELWTAPTVPLPGWARPGLDDTPEFGLDCAVSGEEVVLRWSARTFYSGGAAASPERVIAAEQTASGAVRLNLMKRTVAPNGQLDGPQGLSIDKATRDRLPPAGLGADVLDYGTTDALRIELVTAQAPGGADAVLLCGVDPEAGASRWEIVLDQATHRGPPKLRP